VVSYVWASSFCCFCYGELEGEFASILPVLVPVVSEVLSAGAVRQRVVAAEAGVPGAVINKEQGDLT